MEKLIKHTEDTWLEALYENCKKQFSGVHLPSHNEDHHWRVWKYAKLLVKILQKNNQTINEAELERLIIAVFFHDLGMSKTISKDHGKISRHLCKAFFENRKIIEPAHFNSILDAIEKHDQKEYNEITQKISIQNILNIADDLDAFSILGAYRYTEIYLLRGIEIQNLSENITENLLHRYQNLVNSLHFDDSFVKSQNLRYIAARNFFKDLNFQLKNTEFDLKNISGPIGVVHYIKSLIIDNGFEINKACDKVLSANPDFYTQHFFEKLKKENSIK